MGQEDETASIEVARSAEFVVLDHNPFDIKASGISETGVAGTAFRGNIVYNRKGIW